MRIILCVPTSETFSEYAAKTLQSENQYFPLINIIRERTIEVFEEQKNPPKNYSIKKWYHEKIFFMKLLKIKFNY